MNRLEKLKLTRLLSGGFLLAVLMVGFFSYPIWALSESCCPCEIMFYMNSEANCLTADEETVLELEFNQFPTAVILMTESDSPLSGTCTVLPIFEDIVEYKGHSSKLFFSTKDDTVYLQGEEISEEVSFTSKHYLNPNPWMVDGIWIENLGDVSICGQVEKGTTTLIEGADFTYFEPKKGIALVSIPFVVWLISFVQVETYRGNQNFPQNTISTPTKAGGGVQSEKRKNSRVTLKRNPRPNREFFINHKPTICVHLWLFFH